MAWLRGQPDAGLRWGEIRALRVRRLDLLRARLEVAENVPDGCDESETVTPKSHKRRVVPLPRFLIDALAQQVAGRRPDELVCANGAGGLLDNSNFRRNVFDPAVRAMGVGPFTPTQPAGHRSQPGRQRRSQRQGPSSGCSAMPAPP